MDYDLSYRFGPDQPWRMKGEFDFCFISRYVGCNKRCVSAASVQREHKWMSEQMFATKTRRWYNVGPTSKTLDPTLCQHLVLVSIEDVPEQKGPVDDGRQRGS